MEAVDPHKFVTEIDLKENYGSEKDVHAEVGRGQRFSLLQANDVAPTGDDGEYGRERPADEGMEVEIASSGGVGGSESGFYLAEDDGDEDGDGGKDHVPPADFLQLGIAGEVGNAIADHSKKHHRNDEVNHDGVDGVGVGEVMFVEWG